ncbi:NB-ARC domain-containing protein [Altericista sp. CCNU0014]|uniref:WD40 domain-containing protein n=1 Tax=Altericista sp. CCNU0014 TaxID=3082949 RepID=UPI00384F64A5
MDFDELIILIDAAVYERTQKHLKDTEVLVLRGSWLGQGYEEIAEAHHYTAQYVRQDIGPKLWKLLSQVIGEKVSKTSFRTALERYGRKHLEPKSQANEKDFSPRLARSDLENRSEPQTSVRVLSAAQTDWGDVIDVSAFYGRAEELKTLEQWILRDRCRLVALLGMGGIGKTSLAVKLAERIQGQFEFVFWRSLRNVPAFEDLLASLIHFLSLQQDAALPNSPDAQLACLLNYLRQHRCLILLDNWESVLQSGTSGAYNPGYEGYGQLLRCIAEAQHQSCLIVTSQEKPKGFSQREGNALPVRSLALQGLGSLDAQALFADKGLVDIEPEALAEVLSHYAGNPLALKIIAAAVFDLVDGDLANVIPYLRRGVLQFDDINDLLARHFNRLSAAERQAVYWLAINREPMAIADLELDIVQDSLSCPLPEVIRSLRNRSLVVQHDRLFSLEPVVMEYVTHRLVMGVCDEILSQQMALLRTYALVKAQAKDYVRQAQIQFVLRPILWRLRELLQSNLRIEQSLKNILARARADAPLQAGYVGGNVLNLLRELGADFSGLDCSYLTIWQAYLVDANLSHTNFAHADLSRSSFTAVLSATLSVAFSPDGERFAMGSADDKVRVWQVDGYKEVLTCEGHSNWVCAVAFSPDGSLLASGSFDKTVKLWNLATGQCIKTLSGHGGWVWAIAFSPDGQTLASGADDHTAKIWDVASGNCLASLEGHESTVWSLAYHPDGQTLASSSADKTIRLWNLATGNATELLQGRINRVRSLAFSPDGDFLATGGIDCTVDIWRVKTGECLRSLKGHLQPVICVAFAPSPPVERRSVDREAPLPLLATGSQDCTIRLWNIASGQCVKTLKGHPNGVWSVAFHPSGNLLVSGSNDSTVKLWNPQTGQSLRTLKGYSTGIKSLAFSPDGQYLVSSGDNKKINLWSLTAGECLRSVEGHSSWVWCVVFSPNGHLLASSSNDNTIKLWQTSSWKPIKTLQGHLSLVFAVTFSPDGRTLASASDDTTVRLWDVHTGECLKILPQGGRVWTVTFSPDGQTLACANGEQWVSLWDVAAGTCLRVLTGHTSLIFTASFSPDGRLLASGSDDKTIRLWDVETGNCLKTLEGHSGSVWSVAFSPQGNTLASGCNDTTVKLWSVPDGNCLRTLHGHEREVWAVTFHPQTLELLSAAQEGTIKRWNPATGECLQTLQEDKPYDRMNIEGVTGLTEAQKESLMTLGAIAGDDFSTESASILSPERLALRG